jgi:hypothetical protein
MECYRIAARDTINCDIIPAILNTEFTHFGNVVIPHIFNTLDDIKEWLFNYSKSNIQNSIILENKHHRGANMIYSVYLCNHDDRTHNNDDNIDKFICNIKINKNNSISFIECKNNIVFSSQKDTNIKYSNAPRYINYELHEGIFPVDNIDTNVDIYNKYIKTIHQSDINKDNFKNISLIFVNISKRTWLDTFIKKLDFVEQQLIMISKNNHYIKKNKDTIIAINYIVDLINNSLGVSDTEKQNIKTILIDPIFYNEIIYQCRYNNTFMTWHKYYKYILQTYNIMPSEQFADFILNFNLIDLCKQFYTKEQLDTIITAIHKEYNIPYTDIYSRKEPDFIEYVYSFE